MGSYVFKTEPMAHQRAELRRTWRLREWAYFHDMGSGKSKLVVDGAAALFEHGEIDGLLIVAPKTVCLNWASDEIPKHLPDRIERYVLTWQAGGASARFRRGWDHLLEMRGLAVFVVNVDALVTPKGVKAVEQFLRRRRVYWAVDESTTIKNWKAKRTKAALKLAPLAKYRRILNGTPITNNPLDLWGQCQFLRPGILGETSFWSFRARYANLRERVINGRTFQEIVGFRDLDRLSAALSAFSSRITKEQCLDLPPKQYTRRYVELTPEQARLYKAVGSEFEAALGGASVSADNVLVQLMRLQQILCGHVPTDDGEVREIPSNRLTALLDVIEETDGKVIIWAPYVRDVHAITRALRDKYGRPSVVNLIGDMNGDARYAAMKAFETDPSVRFIAGTQQTGGVGVNLVAARTMIYYANLWDLYVRAQSEDRAHRRGQTNRVTYVDLVAPGTVDEGILSALRAKRTLADAVTDPKELLRWI